MAQGGVHIEAKGLLRKMRNLTSVTYFFENFHRDAVAYLQEQELNNILAAAPGMLKDGEKGPVVGYVSGNLRRSQQLLPVSKYETLLSTNLTIAPYALAVAQRTSSRFGRNFLKMTLDLYGGEVIRLINVEWERAKKVINSGQEYKYQNPFPDLR